MKTVRTNKPRSNHEPPLATEWDRIWHALIHAKQIGDRALEADARRAVDAFNARLGRRAA